MSDSHGPSLLKNPDTASTFVAPWNTLSLPGLVRSFAQSRPDDVVFREAGDTIATLARPAKVLNGRALGAAVEHFARQMPVIGLVPGDCVAFLSLSSCDLAIGILGALMAGLTPLVLPVSLDTGVLTTLIRDCRVAALVAGPDMSGIALATRARSIAADVFGIRAVACFSTPAPEGMVSLAGWAQDELAAPPPVTYGVRGSMMTVDTASAHRIMIRSQHQLIAEALAFSATAQVAARGVILQTLAAGSAFAVISGIVAPLLLKAQSHFLPLFNAVTFTNMVQDGGNNPVIILPAHIESHLSDAQGALHNRAMTLVFAHQPGTGTREQAVIRLPTQKIVDVTLMGEAGTYVLARGVQGRRAPLPENWRQPGARVVEGDGLLIKASLNGAGQISLSGYGVAKPALESHTGVTETAIHGIACEGQAFELAPRMLGSVAA